MKNYSHKSNAESLCGALNGLLTKDFVNHVFGGGLMFVGEKLELNPRILWQYYKEKGKWTKIGGIELKFDPNRLP